MASGICSIQDCAAPSSRFASPALEAATIGRRMIRPQDRARCLPAERAIADSPPQYTVNALFPFRALSPPLSTECGASPRMLGARHGLPCVAAAVPRQFGLLFRTVMQFVVLSSLTTVALFLASLALLVLGRHIGERRLRTDPAGAFAGHGAVRSEERRVGQE